MPNVVVVTRNAALAMGLTRHGYDVSDVRPDRHGDWTREARAADAVVLELPDAVAAESAVQRLRAEGLGVPVLLVANDTPGWTTTGEHLGAGARVLPLPISLPGLTAALEELLKAGPAVPPPPPANETELLSAVAATIGLTIGEGGGLVGDPPLAPDPVAGAVAEPTAEPEAAAAPPGESAADLARALVARAGDLVGIGATAEAVAAEIAERTGAPAAAVLLPGGTGWRVAGGVGLRADDHLAGLAADDPLVTSVAASGTYAAERDRGEPDTPLAAWPRLLAVGVPGLSVVLVAGRAEPFDASATDAATAVAAEAVEPLRDALAVRAAARLLAPYA